MKKLVCIYLVLVMVITGCGRKKITSRDTTLPAVKAVLPQESIEDFYRRQLEEITDPALNGGDEKAEPTLKDTAKKYLYNTGNFLYEHKVAVCATVATVAVCFWNGAAIVEFIRNMLPQHQPAQQPLNQHQQRDLNQFWQRINQQYQQLAQQIPPQNLARHQIYLGNLENQLALVQDKYNYQVNQQQLLIQQFV